MCSKQNFIIRSSLHTGVAPGAYKKTNKQTNDRVSNIGTYFSCVFVFSFMNYNHRYSWNYFLLLDFFYLNFRDNLLELRIYFESLTYSDVRQVPSYDLYSLLGRKLFISFLLIIYIYIYICIIHGGNISHIS